MVPGSGLMTNRSEASSEAIFGVRLRAYRVGFGSRLERGRLFLRELVAKVLEPNPKSFPETLSFQMLQSRPR